MQKIKPFKIFQVWTARLMLGVLLMSSVTPTRVEASPPRWAKKAGGATLSLTAEMARFFTASAVVTYWECVRTQDPVKCQIFLRSLEDIHTYAGFVIFVAASRATGFTTYHLTRGRFNGQFLGMAAGLFSSELYNEFREHPKVKELLASKDPQRYQQLLNELWQEFLANPEWWESKVPSLVGLIGGTIAGAMTIPLISKTAKGARVVLDLSKATQKSTVAYRAAQGLRKTEAWIRFYKKVVSGKVRNPAVWITGELGMMILFLKYSEWIENPARLWWNDQQGFSAFKEKFDFFENRMNLAEMIDPSFNWEKAAREVEIAWDDYRSAQILEAKMVQAEYQGELSRLDQQMITPYFYYLWFADRMRPDSDVIRENPFGWKPGTEEEIQNYLKSFFCGPTPDEAIQRSKSIWNMPIPGRAQDEIIPFRIAHEEKACEAPSVPWMDRSLDQSIFHKKRVELLSSGNNYEDLIEKAQSHMVELVEPLRASLIERYQSHLKETMLEVLESKDVRNSDPALKKGIIASYAQEEEYWKRKDQEFGSKTPIFKKALERVAIKQNTVEELKRYLEDFGAFQKQFEEELFADAFDEDPATGSIEKWKSFMLINKGASK